MTAAIVSATACLGEAFRYISANLRDLLMIATPPVIGLTIVESLVRLAVPAAASFGPAQGVPAPATGLAIVGLGVLNLVFYVMFAVAWHRKYLVPHEVVTVAEALKWRPEKTRFLLYAIAISVLAVLAAGVVGLAGMALGMVAPPLGVIAMFAAAFAGLVAFARWSLVLPAAALGRAEFGLLEAWRASRGNTLTMTLILLLPAMIAVFAAIPAMIVALVFGGVGLMDTTTGYAIVALVGLALNYFAIAVGVSSLSAAYLRLVGT